MASKGGKSGVATDAVRLFFFGPGLGESIVVQLPGNQWGVVDCYAKANSKHHRVLEFLTRKKVKKLAFFCLTHPHADHYQGTHQLLRHYAGNVERIWRYGGLSGKELLVKITLAALAKHRKTGDPEAKELADEFVQALVEIGSVGAKLPPENYCLITGPMSLLKTKKYEITALRPTGAVIDDVQDRVAQKIVADGYLALNEEEGAVLNSLSVVLMIKLKQAQIVLLGDAEGAEEQIPGLPGQVAVLKIAHHGSENGLGAQMLRTLVAKGAARSKPVRFGVITPYNRSSLPRSEMLDHYRASTDTLIFTGGDAGVTRPKKFVPGMRNPRLAHDEAGGVWHGVEVTAAGSVCAYD